MRCKKIKKNIIMFLLLLWRECKRINNENTIAFHGCTIKSYFDYFV